MHTFSELLLYEKIIGGTNITNNDGNHVDDGDDNDDLK